MNYTLFVESQNIDKVILKLTQYEDSVIIRNVLRTTGMIMIKTKLLAEIKKISEIVEIKKETALLPSFLL